MTYRSPRCFKAMLHDIFMVLVTVVTTTAGHSVGVRHFALQLTNLGKPDVAWEKTEGKGIIFLHGGRHLQNAYNAKRKAQYHGCECKFVYISSLVSCVSL